MLRLPETRICEICDGRYWPSVTSHPKWCAGCAPHSDSWRDRRRAYANTVAKHPPETAAEGARSEISGEAGRVVPAWALAPLYGVASRVSTEAQHSDPSPSSQEDTLEIPAFLRGSRKRW